MKRPYFKVGECVLIYSKGYGVSGYETTVIDRIEAIGNIEFGSGKLLPDGWKYKVSPCPLNLEWPKYGWSEAALRKKYDPGDSFESLMQKLKKPVEV